MRPFFPYYGSKWNMARYYASPQYTQVIEPFAGAAGYSTFYDVEVALLCDIDPIIANLWAYLINVSADEIMALPELLSVGDSVDNYDLSAEAKSLIGFWLNRGSATPKKSRTAYSARTDRAQLNWSRKAKERITKQLHGIRNWRVVCDTYVHAPNWSATWFVDPPYADKGKFYRHTFSNFEHLAQWCRQREGQTIVCENAGASWLPFVSLGSFKSSRGVSNEVTWTNNGCI